MRGIRVGLWLGLAFSWVATLEARQQAAPLELEPLPSPRLEGTEPEVRALLSEQQEVVEDLLGQDGVPAASLAAAYGDLGKLYMAYQFAAAAEVCFANALTLAPADLRWSYYLGLLDIEGQRFALATERFAAVVEARPQDLGAWMRLGEAWLGLERPAEARRAYERALSIEPAPVGPAAAAPRYGLGRVALLEGDDRDAVRWLEEALAAQPNARRLHYLLAQAYRRLGEPQKAAEHAGQFAPVDVVFPEPLVAEMRTLAESADFHIASGDRAAAAGHFDFAERSYRKALELEPNDAKAHQGLGAMLERRGDVEAALAQYREAARLDPTSAARRANLGRLLADLGRLEEAAGELEEAIRRDPRNEPALLRLAAVRLEQGEAEQALELYDRVLSWAPQHPVALVERPMVLKSLGREEEALRELRRAVEIAPSAPRAYLNLATTLLERGDPRAAESVLEDGLAAAAGMEPVLEALFHYNLGVARSRDGRDPEARASFAEALTLDPQLVAARFHLATALAREGAYDEAARRYGEVLEQEPEHLPARLAQATALVLAERWREALAALAAGLQTMPGEANLVHSLARLLLVCPDPELRDGQRALELAQRAFDESPTLEHGETLAMAFAEVGAFEDAVRLQSGLLREAEKLGDPRWVERLRRNLRRYELGLRADSRGPEGSR